MVLPDDIAERIGRSILQSGFKKRNQIGNDNIKMENNYTKTHLGLDLTV